MYSSWHHLLYLIGHLAAASKLCYAPDGSVSPGDGYLPCINTLNVDSMCCVLNVTTVTQKLDWLGTTRAKAGYAAGNWLFYGTGGLAYGHVVNSLQLVLPTNVPPDVFFASKAAVQVGWSAGGGVEYGAGPWVFRAEYLHYDLGSQTVTAPQTGGFPVPGTSLSASQKATGDLLRGAISYRF